MTKIKDAWGKYNSVSFDRNSSLEDLLNLSEMVDSYRNLDFFIQKKTDLNSILNDILSTLNEHGDLISNNQSMNKKGYYLTKIWEDIIFGATTVSGYGQNSIFIYSSINVAGDDKIDSKKVIEFLKNLKLNIEETNNYTNLTRLLVSKQEFLLKLDITKKII